MSKSRQFVLNTMAHKVHNLIVAAAATDATLFPNGFYRIDMEGVITIRLNATEWGEYEHPHSRELANPLRLVMEEVVESELLSADRFEGVEVKLALAPREERNIFEPMFGAIGMSIQVTPLFTDLFEPDHVARVEQHIASIFAEVANGRNWRLAPGTYRLHRREQGFLEHLMPNENGWFEHRPLFSKDLQPIEGTGKNPPVVTRRVAEYFKGTVANLETTPELANVDYFQISLGFDDPVTLRGIKIKVESVMRQSLETRGE